LTNPTEEHQQEPKDKKPDGNRLKALIAIGTVSVVVLVTVIATNFDSIFAHTGATNPTGQETELSAGPNTAPVIISLTPTTDRIAPVDVCDIVCEAGDVDGDTLTYTWTADQGEVYGEGRSVKWGAPDTEGLFRVSVVVDDGRGGTAEQSMSLRVKANYAPEIQSLSASPEWAEPGTSTQISCTATDADGDEIAYEWEASFGETSGQGNSISWLAPEKPGSYVVTVYVRDGYGGASQRNILINVSLADAPKLGTFVVEPIDHDMLKFESEVWDIFIGRSCTVECVVVEAEEPLTFTWSVDVGTLTSDGSSIATWEAPEVRGPATITVDVTDVNGNTTTGILLMYAEDCTCAF